MPLFNSVHNSRFVCQVSAKLPSSYIWKTTQKSWNYPKNMALEKRDIFLLYFFQSLCGETNFSHILLMYGYYLLVPSPNHCNLSSSRNGSGCLMIVQHLESGANQWNNSLYLLNSNMVFKSLLTQKRLLVFPWSWKGMKLWMRTWRLTLLNGWCTVELCMDGRATPAHEEDGEGGKNVIQLHSLVHSCGCQVSKSSLFL